ncbi:phospholipase D-like domain-containing protein [Burkholderiaceae bacterium FT117]|uniref:phospholipase D-like domain-containing protein n=1 Tax=Zeimonas sediminis TaxID=2944268 RepID=UPI002342D386|nr:phospholipase D-like domain-containing protein [Zeimonas sediminis]MCM5570145.1 phospholipase D-like domain-containing protein [Zeimonas sediminis]
MTLAPDASRMRLLAEQAFSRAAGAPLLGGNRIRLLKDGAENYPAWLAAIGEARRSVMFENYIVHDDAVGSRFADALIDAASRGVRVRMAYDWLGCLRSASRGYWERLRQGGVEVRVFNPPSFDSPLGWVSRNHRKSLCVDDSVAFVSGLCIGRMWEGDPERGIAPWRDTGVELRGPAVAEVARAFARAWATTGAPLPADELPEADAIAPAGEAELRVLASMPSVAGLYRLDHLIAALARDTLWLTDAYFVGTASYVQALRQAAMDGVDVRLLVPGASDIPALSPVSRAGYRPLLEAGVRVFEWNGPMLHAKTAVADRRWARVGSSNLNIASWLGNWELDIAAEDADFAADMEAAYLEDLSNATEILLGQRNRIRPADPGADARAAERRRRLRAERRAEARARRDRGDTARTRRSGGSAGQIAAGAIRVGNTFGAALANRRVLGAAEAKTMTMAGTALAVVAVVAALWPRLLAWPLAAFSAWSAIALLLRAWRLHRRGRPGPAGNPPARGGGAAGSAREPPGE